MGESIVDVTLYLYLRSGDEISSLCDSIAEGVFWEGIIKRLLLTLGECEENIINVWQ